jgi:hypothetical protein
MIMPKITFHKSEVFSMSIKFLIFTYIFLVLSLSSCSNLSIEKNSNSSNSSNPVEMPKPIENTVYDVICFGVNSCISDISKVPRGTTVSLYTQKESSVQQGTKESLYVKTTSNKIGINESEMELLASKDANVYAFMNLYGCLSVSVYKKGQGFVKIEEKEYNLDFITGNTTGSYKITNDPCFSFKFRQP